MSRSGEGDGTDRRRLQTHRDRGRAILVLAVAGLFLGLAGCGGDDGGETGASVSESGGSGKVCTDVERDSDFFSSDRESAGAVADRGPAGITYEDGRDIAEMVTCAGGAVGAVNLAGSYSFADWASTVCRGMWDEGGFVTEDTPTLELSMGVHEEARLGGVSSITFSIPSYDGPGTYDATLVGVRMGTELPDEERRPEVAGTGTLVIEWASWGEAVLGTSSSLRLIGSFQGEITGDLTLSIDVPVFGCTDVA